MGSISVVKPDESIEVEVETGVFGDEVTGERGLPTLVRIVNWVRFVADFGPVFRAGAFRIASLAPRALSLRFDREVSTEHSV